MRKCLLFPDAAERSGLAPLCPGQRGIVFMGLRDEEVPRFIVDAVMELKGKGIVGEAARPVRSSHGRFWQDQGNPGGRIWCSC